MIEKIVNSHLLKSKLIAEVYINVTSSEALDLNVVILKKQRDKLEIEHTCHTIMSFEQFEKEVPRNMPICLIIDGKGTFQKSISKRNDIPVIHQVLPNAVPEDFILQEQELEDGKCYIVVARKDFVEGWIKRFTDHGYYVIDVSIGPCVISRITGLLAENGHEVKVRNYQIKYNEKGICEISKNGTDEEVFKFTVGEELLTNLDLVPFAAGVKYFKDADVTTNPVYPLYKSSKEEWVFKKIFKKTGSTILMFMFSILIINFLLYGHYKKAYSVSNRRYIQHHELLEKLDKLNIEYTQQKSFIETSGILGTTIFSFFADRLAWILPDDVLLTQLNIYPIKEKIKSGNQVSCENNKIIIRGNTKKSIALNLYINLIEKENWVHDVNLVSFVQEDASVPGEFEIEILIK